MKKFKLVFILIALICLAFPQPGFAKDTKNVGKIASVSGTVELKKSGGKKAFKAVKNMSITQGDTISTGAKSKAALHIDSDKEVTIAANTKVVIKQLVKSIKADQGKTQLSLVGGKVKVKINKKLQGDSKFQVQTPNAIMGVMGTEFDVAYDGERTYLGVEQGIVRVTLPEGDSQSDRPVMYDVEAPQWFDVDENGNVTQRPLTDADRQFFEGESDLSQTPTDSTPQHNAAQAIQYGPVVATTDDDDDSPSSSGGSASGGGGSSGGTTNPNEPADQGNTTNPDAPADNGNTTNPDAPADTGNTTNPDAPADTGNTTNPDAPADNGNTTNPDAPADTGNTTNPDVPADTGNTTNPDVPADSGDTTPAPAPTEQEQGFAEGVTAKKTLLLSQIKLDATSTAFAEIIDQDALKSQPYWEGRTTGSEQAYNYTGDPTEDYTAGYETGYAERFVDSYLQGYEMTHLAMPAFASYIIDDIVLFYHYYNTVPSDSVFDIAFMDGLASVDKLEFARTTEAQQHYDEAYNTRIAELSAFSPDEIRAFGEQEGFIETIFSLGYERGNQQGGDDGLTAGETSTP